MEKTQKHIHGDNVPYGDYSEIYPEQIMRTMRTKRIIAPNGAIEHDEILFGPLEIDVGAEYPPHYHEAPEVYYVTEDEAGCLFGGKHFVARKGSVIQTAPN